MSNVIDYDPLCPPPAAWIGYDAGEFSRGNLVINLCGECDGLREAETLVRLLRCRSFRTLCRRHLAEQIARRLGEKPF